MLLYHSPHQYLIMDDRGLYNNHHHVPIVLSSDAIALWLILLGELKSLWHEPRALSNAELRWAEHIKTGWKKGGFMIFMRIYSFKYGLTFEKSMRFIEIHRIYPLVNDHVQQLYQFTRGYMGLMPQIWIYTPGNSLRFSLRFVVSNGD